MEEIPLKINRNKKIKLQLFSQLRLFFTKFRVNFEKSSYCCDFEKCRASPQLVENIRPRSDGARGRAPANPAPGGACPGGAAAPPGAGPENSAGAKTPPGAGPEKFCRGEAPPGAGPQNFSRGEAPPGAG